jgi:hypothetical protein
MKFHARLKFVIPFAGYSRCLLFIRYFFEQVQRGSKYPLSQDEKF